MLQLRICYLFLYCGGHSLRLFNAVTTTDLNIVQIKVFNLEDYLKEEFGDITR